MVSNAQIVDTADPNNIELKFEPFDYVKVVRDIALNNSPGFTAQHKRNLIRKYAWFKKIKYEPHPKQVLYHNSPSRFKFPTCGRRFGKSYMAARDLEPELLENDKHFWIVGPTYSLGEKEFRVVWKDLIIDLQLGKDKSIEKAYSKNQGNMYIKFKNRNTIIEVKSADNPENLVGDSLDGVIMSEAAKHKKDTWERYIRPALADKRGTADFPTTPEGFNWYYDEWMHGFDPELKEYESWRFPSWDNPYVYPNGEQDSEIKLLKRTMSDEAFNQEIGADFSSFVGKIYPEWNIQEHVKAHEYRPDWPNYIAFDWGYANPQAAVEFQISPRDTVHIWRIHYKSHTTNERFLQEMQEREQPPGYRIALTFGDAADPEAVRTVNEKFAPCIADPNAKTNWRQGVDLIRSFLERESGEDEFGGPIYETALTVDPKCVEFIREINNYKTGTNAKGNNVTEQGIKADDHCLDAFRYGMVHIYELGATSSLYEVMDMPLKPASAFTESKLDSVNGYESHSNSGDSIQIDREALVAQIRAQLLTAIQNSRSGVSMPGITNSSMLSDASTAGYFNSSKEF